MKQTINHVKGFCVFGADLSLPSDNGANEFPCE